MIASQQALTLSRGQRLSDNTLRFLHNAIQMNLALKTFRVNFVDIFRAGGSGGKPAGICFNLETTDERIVAWSARELGHDCHSRVVKP